MVYLNQNSPLGSPLPSSLERLAKALWSTIRSQILWPSTLLGLSSQALQLLAADRSQGGGAADRPQGGDAAQQLNLLDTLAFKYPHSHMHPNSHHGFTLRRHATCDDCHPARPYLRPGTPFSGYRPLARGLHESCILQSTPCIHLVRHTISRYI